MHTSKAGKGEAFRRIRDHLRYQNPQYIHRGTASDAVPHFYFLLMVKLLKLLILRALAMLGAFAAWKVTRKQRFQWLFHYLQGTGRPLHLPGEVITGAQETLARLWAATAPEVLTGELPGQHFKNNVLLGHSTEYAGAGFQGRPEAFYTVGGFHYTVEVSQRCAGGKVELTGEDVYDWHAITEERWDEESYSYVTTEQWYTSPFPAQLGWLVKLAAKVFGSEYFVVGGWPMGEAGISNRLWADLAQVGARPFTTVIRHVWSLQAWRALAWAESPRLRARASARRNKRTRVRFEAVGPADYAPGSTAMISAFHKAQVVAERQRELAERMW